MITEFEEFTLDPDTWRNIGRPPLDETWKRKVESIFVNGRPLRVVWGGQEEVFIAGDEDVPSGYYHKYQVGSPMEVLKGYKWTRDGKEEFVSALNGDAEIPTGVMVIPVYEYVSIGKPRWIVECWMKEGRGVEKDGYYEAWVIESLEMLDPVQQKVISRYREPSEMDVKMGEHLRYEVERLTDRIIKQELDKKAEETARQKEKQSEEEFEIDKEEFEQFLVDNRNKEFEYEAPQIDANAYLKQLQKAHQEHGKLYE